MTPGKRNWKSAELMLSVPDVPLEMQAGMLELSHIEVPLEDRLRGYASELMQSVCDEANASAKVLMLVVSSNGEMKNGELIRFYEKYGFRCIQKHPIIMARPPVLSFNILRSAMRQLAHG